MHQDTIWYGCRPQPRGLCVRWRPSLHPQKEGGTHQIFGPCLLWPNGWMDQDATWHEKGVIPGDSVLDGDPAPSATKSLCGNFWAAVCKTACPMLSDCCLVCPVCLYSVTLVYCDQTAGWIKIKLGMELGPAPAILLHGDPTSPPPKKRGTQPIFGPCPLWLNGWMV